MTNFRMPLALVALLLASTAHAASLPVMKKQAIAGVEARAKLAQQMNDSIFSFGELGFQEVETSKYITGVLEKNGFKVTRGISGLPTGWVATWTNKTG
jgi:aminobenzoyl-glutamate utilization protein B